MNATNYGTVNTAEDSGTLETNWTIVDTDANTSNTTSDESDGSTAQTLTEDTHTVTATFTDPAGNVSAASTALTVIVDTTAPAAPAAPDLHTVSDSGVSDTDDITWRYNGVRFVLVSSNATNDLGRYHLDFVIDSDAAKSSGCTAPAYTQGRKYTAGTNAQNTLTNGGVNLDIARNIGSSLQNNHICVFFQQEDLAGNHVFSPALEMVNDRTSPSLTGLAFNLPDTNDSTRDEIVADGEDSPTDDGDTLWNPGKTDDYTNQDHFDLVYSNVPSDEWFETRHQVSVQLQYTPVDHDSPTFALLAARKNHCCTIRCCTSRSGWISYCHHPRH